jgi:uncharacterized membrane protein AbrB (regulator of aidB expression)
MAIGFGIPDFGLIVLGACSMYLDRKGATLLGFGAGWVMGSLAGVNLTLYVLSRTVAGFLLGWALGLGVQRNFLVSALATVGITLIAQLMMLFLGAHHGPLLPYLAGTLVTTMYDGVIAIMLFGIISKIVDPRRQERY